MTCNFSRKMTVEAIVSELNAEHRRARILLEQMDQREPMTDGPVYESWLRSRSNVVDILKNIENDQSTLESALKQLGI